MISVFEMRDLGLLSFFLGILIRRDREQRMLTISQEAYVEKVLKRFGMADLNPTTTPMVQGLVLEA